MSKCKDCKNFRICAKANGNKIEYDFICIANDNTFVNINAIADKLSECIDYEQEVEEVCHTKVLLEIKDLQKMDFEINSDKE